LSDAAETRAADNRYLRTVFRFRHKEFRRFLDLVELYPAKRTMHPSQIIRFVVIDKFHARSRRGQVTGARCRGFAAVTCERKASRWVVHGPHAKTEQLTRV
jgi:hypothetical protein